MPGSSTRPPSELARLPIIAALTSVTVGLLVLVGWQWNLMPLKSLLPGLVAMNPLTAVGFVLAGVSLGAAGRGGRSARAVGLALAACVAGIGAAKLCDVLLHTHYQLDRLLFTSKLAAVGALPANQMAPNTALSFALAGLGLLIVRWQIGRVRPAQGLALMLAGFSLLAVLGYALAVRQLYDLPNYIPMALNTALAFGVLSLGILFAPGASGLTRIYLAADVGGVLARRMTLVAVIIPTLLAWLRVHAQQAGIFEVEPSISVMVFTSIAVLTGFVWISAHGVQGAERGRVAALAELRAARDGLEQSVQERTAELRGAYEQLQQEMAERERTQHALNDSEGRYRLLFFSNPQPMWVYDRHSLAFLAVNEAAVRLYGYTENEFLAMTIAGIRPPEDLPALHDHLQKHASGEQVRGTWRHRRKDGALVDVEITSHRLPFAGHDGMLVLAEDVTGRKQLEAQFRQAQKMEAVGQLAGGVAHDFNNLLTAILGYAQLIVRRLGPNDPTASDAAEIASAAERAAGLTRQLLAFSRRQVLQPRVLDLNTLVRDLDKMLRRLIGDHLDLRTVPGAGLGAIKADPGQVEQVVVNLVVNARDAMPDGGRLTIETANVDLDERYHTSHPYAPPGRYTMLAVSDTGCGMDATTRSRIFEPFFTTKAVGKGTGLGLSTVHGIVKQSGGSIEVYSEPGHGTTFKVYFPCVAEAVGDTADRRPAAQGMRGHETILVVEDESIVRRIVVETLRQAGYTIHEAAEPAKALELVRGPHGHIDLLLTDVVMPGLSGPTLAREVTALRPNLPVLFMSGYAEQATIHRGLFETGAAFLQKPFTPDVLLERVRQALDRPTEQAA